MKLRVTSILKPAIPSKVAKKRTLIHAYQKKLATDQQ